MNLKSYLNLYSLLKSDTSSLEERRAFGLKHSALKDKSIKQLIEWEKLQSRRLKKPLLSELLSSYLYRITFILTVIAFVFGLLSGVALLSYNGHEPVNVVYFIAMVVFFPILTMSLTLFSMLRANKRESVLVHLTPAYWMEKILKLLPVNLEKNIKEFKINPLLTNWIVIRRSQLIALFFSLGLLLSLLMIVATKDIAFAWSSTLKISPENFHSFLDQLAFPWREFFPSGVPSLGLIEQSQYFRLGDKLSKEMINNASILGEWWKFLAFATLFYALLLRLLMYIGATLGYKHALNKSILSLKGSIYLLNNMNEPMITTSATESEYVMTSSDNDMKFIRTLEPSYDVIQGWSMSTRRLEVLNDIFQVTSSSMYEVGGSNTLDEDRSIIRKSMGKVLLYVKAWEPPTLDIVDYIETLLEYADKVIVYPIGTEEDKYQTKEKFLTIWSKKLSMMNHNKLWVKI